MNHLQLNQAALPDLSIVQISRLSKDQLAHFSYSIAEISIWAQHMRKRINMALELRYDAQIEQASNQLSGSPSQFRIDDGDLQIDVSQSKSVDWDQAILSQIAERMTAAGDRVQDFMQVEYSVAETDYAKWHPLLRAAFLPARTEFANDLSFQIRWVGEVQLIAQ